MTGWDSYDEWEARDRTFLEAAALARHWTPSAPRGTVHPPPPRSHPVPADPPPLSLLDATQRHLDEETLDAIAKANGITRDELDRRIRLTAERRTA